MKILHIVAGVPPGSGMAESVPALCRHLRQLGHEVTLATLDGPLSEAAQAAGDAGVRLVRIAPSWPHALFFSWQMLRGLPARARAADAVHVHGAWTFPVWWGCCCALRAGKLLVMSPRGALNPVTLKHSAWKKRLAGWLDRACLRRAAAVHVTSEAERGWTEAYCDHGGVAMASVKTGAGRAGARAGHAIGISRGESPEEGAEDHGVVAMASVKTGAGRAGADVLYGDIRFVADRRGIGLDALRAEPTVRYYSSRHWRPWMLQWGFMPPHPSVYIRRECFERLGDYALDYRIAADYALLVRFLRKARLNCRYVPMCFVDMRVGGMSTRNWRSNLLLNREIVRGNREAGYFCCLPMLLPKYAFKVWEFVLPRLLRPRSGRNGECKNGRGAGGGGCALRRYPFCGGSARGRAG